GLGPDAQQAKRLSKSFSTPSPSRLVVLLIVSVGFGPWSPIPEPALALVRARPRGLRAAHPPSAGSGDIHCPNTVGPMEASTATAKSTRTIAPPGQSPGLLPRAQARTPTWPATSSASATGSATPSGPPPNLPSRT